MKNKSEMPEQFKEFWHNGGKPWPIEKKERITLHENVSEEWRSFLTTLMDTAEKKWN